MTEASSQPPIDTRNLDFEWIRQEVEAANGSFYETEHHVITHVPGQERLVVSFDNLASLEAQGPRKPWGYEMVRERQWGSLGVMIKAKDWFRSIELSSYLTELRDQGLFSSYPAVSMYGSSMGGYGACLFAPLAPGCTVVAFAPQSSLSAQDAPFEKRYRYARRNYDWTRPEWRDAAQGLPHAGKAYLIYDPTVSEDQLHARRLHGSKVIDLAWPDLTHKVPPSLKRMGILKPVSLGMLEGSMTKTQFHKLLRVRMKTSVYVHRMLERASAKGHHALVEQAISGLPTDVVNWKIRQLRRQNSRMAHAVPAL
ncbi:hypothetical protein [Thioclava indica]|uniref:Phosphoadenosine phosphosulfate reductase n=1 Tax=Thioclava indica TaxID=1353528 RepID=A0A074JXA0_9RHOB|nr:hypothetical protein [Thioclava indica]KEO60193.1 hypothetical protein DT23_13800 [Thioclava indica]